MRKLLTVGLVLLLLAAAGCGKADKKEAASNNAAIRVTDDAGKTIALAKPAKRIISLYAAHTENLVALGLDKEIIGVSRTETAAAVKNRPVFDYRADPEKILAAEPDLVLVRPFVRRAHPEFVRAMENAGVVVASFYPDTFAEFDGYIERLAALTGREQAAKEKLAAFHRELQALDRQSAGKRPQVFFEVSSNQRTVTGDSIPAGVIRAAGGDLVNLGGKPTADGTSVVPYDLEQLVAAGEKIDYYVAQRGPMNAAVTPAAIRSRPGYDTMRAVKNGGIVIVPEELVSRPTFQLLEGAKLLASAWRQGQ